MTPYIILYPQNSLISAILKLVFIIFIIGFCYQVQFEKKVITFALNAYCAKIMDIPC